MPPEVEEELKLTSRFVEKKSVAYNIPRKTLLNVIEKILELRIEQQLGALRRKYYLDRYHLTYY